MQDLTWASGDHVEVPVRSRGLGGTEMLLSKELSGGGGKGLLLLVGGPHSG